MVWEVGDTIVYRVAGQVGVAFCPGEGDRREDLPCVPEGRTGWGAAALSRRAVRPPAKQKRPV